MAILEARGHRWRFIISLLHRHPASEELDHPVETSATNPPPAARPTPLTTYGVPVKRA